MGKEPQLPPTQEPAMSKERKREREENHKTNTGNTNNSWALWNTQKTLN